MTDNYQLQEITVKEEGSGIPMIKMVLPGEWITSLHTDRKIYNGFGEPMNVRLQCSSKDRQSLITYNSNCHYCDSRLSQTVDFSTDLYGTLYRKFIPVKEFLERTVEKRLSKNDNIQFIRYEDWPANDDCLKDYQKWISETNRDPYTSVDNFYYRGGTIEYSFCTNNGTPYRCVCSAIVEAADYAVVRSLPREIVGMLKDPLSGDIGRMAMGGYRNAHYDENYGTWVYTANDYKDWYVSQMILMVMPEQQYADQYNSIYLPVVSYGAHYTPELQNEMDSLQASINRHNKETMDAAFRKPGKNTASDYAEAERRRQSDREAREKLRRTREETAAIQNSMYENRQRSDAKIREMRNDAMMGYTRYTDRYGSEHVIHSTDQYAYRKGDTYVTSSHPLDYGYDWEELDKKKY